MRRGARDEQTFAEQFIELKQDYSAARQNIYRRRRRGLAPDGAGADYHFKNEADWLRIIENARDMDRNDQIVGQTVDRAVCNTVQQGIRLDPQTSDPAVNARLSERWYEWSSTPETFDYAKELSLNDAEQLVLREMLIDGDIVINGTTEGSLQFIEAHRVRTPGNTRRNVVLGVLLDANTREHLEYWVTRDEIGLMNRVERVGDIVQLRTRNDEGVRQVFHVYHPKRVSQTRGVSAFAPLFDTLGQFEDVTFAKLVQQQIVSAFVIFRQREMGATRGGQKPGTDDQTGVREEVPRPDGSTAYVENIRPGIQVTGAEGETLHGFSPNVPNPEFFEHVRLTLQIIGVNLGLPLAYVLLDASETNFSGWRGASDQAKIGFRRNQAALIRRFHKPVYEWKLTQWVRQDRMLASDLERMGWEDFSRAQWHPPTWPYIQPLQDAQADLIRVANSLTSPRRIQAERGADLDRVVDEIIADNAAGITKAKQAAAELNAQFPNDEPVRWQDLYPIPTPDGVRVSLSQTRSDTE